MDDTNKNKTNNMQTKKINQNDGNRTLTSSQILSNRTTNMKKY